MDDLLYKHVLYKDLLPYLKKTDYLGGLTSTEQAYVRHNIGAVGKLELNKLAYVQQYDRTYEELLDDISKSNLKPGATYNITGFKTIYSSIYKNDEGKLITWGNDILPSTSYDLIATAYSDTLLLPLVFIIQNSKLWIATYDPTQETLDDGQTTMGKLTYLMDSNRNQADFDFKNLKVFINDTPYYLFLDSDGNENSDNCHYNNCCELIETSFIGNAFNNFIQGSNNIIKVPISNLSGELNNSIIEDIDLDTKTNKQTVLFESKYYIDYLDLETLTHQFYATTDNIHTTS